MTWDRYGWTGRHPYLPWWLLKDRGDGLVDMVREDCPQLRISRKSPRGPARTPERMTELARDTDRKFPRTAPQVCAQQVWHFPRNDVDLAVVRREGASFWMCDYGMDAHGDANGIVEIEEWTDGPPRIDGEVGWLVYGPGAPWAPPEEDE